MKHIPSLVALLLVSLTFFGCPGGGGSVSHLGRTPEQVVKSFIEISTSAKETRDKKRLQELCVGELRRTFERMNEEAFRLIYLDSKIGIEDFKVLDSKAEGESARVLYQVVIENRQGTDPTKEINQREVDLVRSQGAWYIDTIKLKGTDQIAFTRGMLF